MAQLVERLVRNEEASGSNPLISTKRNLNRTTFGLGFSFSIFTISKSFYGVSLCRGTFLCCYNARHNLKLWFLTVIFILYLYQNKRTLGLQIIIF